MHRTRALAVAFAAVLAGCGAASVKTPSASAPRLASPAVVTTRAGAPRAGALAPPVGPVAVEVEPPPAIRRAGDGRLAQFELGRSTLAQLGCLACHRLAANGNPGPGPDLTRVGARLSASQIERALTHPTEPMPSFGRLREAKLQALVAFLSLLGR